MTNTVDTPEQGALETVGAVRGLCSLLALKLVETLDILYPEAFCLWVYGALLISEIYYSFPLGAARNLQENH